ncbi:unnamed protein product [Gadus morhua 'NCC']
MPSDSGAMASCCYNLRDWDLFPTTENEKVDQNKTDDIALIGIVEELHSCGCDPGLDGFWDLEGAPRTHVTRAPPNVGPAVYIEPARGLQLHSVTGQCSQLPPLLAHQQPGASRDHSHPLALVLLLALSCTSESHLFGLAA